MEYLVNPEPIQTRRDFLKIIAVSAGTSIATFKLMKDDEKPTFEEKILATVEKVKNNTCRIEGHIVTPFGEKTVTGSGVVIVDKIGRKFILTNAHVTHEAGIRKNRSMDDVYKVMMYSGSDKEDGLEFHASPIVLANGERAHTYPDSGYDMSLLNIPIDAKLKPETTGIEMRDYVKDPIRVGETAIAFGTPFGMRDNISVGVVSNTERLWETERNNIFLMTDASVSPGNSGGALVDADGRLIAINTWGVRGAATNGSIRIDVIKRLLEEWGVPVMSQEEKNAEVLKRMKEESEEKEEDTEEQEDATEEQILQMPKSLRQFALKKAA